MLALLLGMGMEHGASPYLAELESLSWHDELNHSPEQCETKLRDWIDAIGKD
jgi:hypothetical protein